MDQTIMVGKTANLTIAGEGTILGSNNGANNSTVIYTGGNLTIDGNVIFEGGSGSDQNAVIRVDRGTTTINGGYFLAKGNNPCIYACPTKGEPCEIKIYGGVFETEGDQNGWYPVLNIHDSYRSLSTILVYGGTFVNYDPATGDNTGQPGDTFVANGYKSVKIDNYNGTGKSAWEIVPE